MAIKTNNSQPMLEQGNNSRQRRSKIPSDKAQRFTTIKVKDSLSTLLQTKGSWSTEEVSS